jgi:hypothetical protein
MIEADLNIPGPVAHAGGDDDGLREIVSAWEQLAADIRKVIVGVVRRTQEAREIRRARASGRSPDPMLHRGERGI